MDLNNILLAIIIFLLGFYILKRFVHLSTIAVLGIAIAFTGTFVLKDMLHLPVDNYVDTSKLEEFRLNGTDYIDKKIDTVTNNNDEDNVTSSLNSDIPILDDSNLNSTSDTSNDLINYNIDITSNYFEYKYDQLTDEYKIFIYEHLKTRVDDERFKEKFFGMSRFVEVEYDLINARMFNKDNEYLIIQFY